MKHLRRTWASARRRGGTSPVVLVLLAGIFLALVVLIVVIVTQKRPEPPPPPPPVPEGQTIQRKDLTAPPKSPKPLDDPNRIKETLQAGKTYRVVLKAGFDARAEDKAWGVKEVISLAYAAEMQIDRTIEKNDGKQIVELRHFVNARNVKLLCNVERVTIDLGTPGTLLLGALEYLMPGTTEVVAGAKPIAEGILGYGAQEAARSAATKAVAHVDALSGKKVRITYVDGVGVESIEPVGCSLSQDESDFVFGTAILSDCYIWDLKKAPGERWTVDGSQLSGLIDPSLRGRAAGEIGFIRDADGQEGDRPYATLRIEGGALTIDRSDASTQRIGSFEPRGTLRFSLADKIVEQAKLDGRFVVDEVSTDHILFETSFHSRPTLTVVHACTVR
jgi:hypothetical protein